MYMYIYTMAWHSFGLGTCGRTYIILNVSSPRTDKNDVRTFGACVGRGSKLETFLSPSPGRYSRAHTSVNIALSALPSYTSSPLHPPSLHIHPSLTHDSSRRQTVLERGISPLPLTPPCFGRLPTHTSLTIQRAGSQTVVGKLCFFLIKKP